MTRRPFDMPLCDHPGCGKAAAFGFADKNFCRAHRGDGEAYLTRLTTAPPAAPPPPIVTPARWPEPAPVPAESDPRQRRLL